MSNLFHLQHGSPTYSPPGCNMRPEATFVIHAYTIKLHNNLGN